MRDPELVARARYAAARLEQAWERWRTVHGLAGSADPLASYVGYSLREPMGQPRVVIGVDAAEAERFADFLENHECRGHAQVQAQPGSLSVNGTARPAGADIAPAAGAMAPELDGRMGDSAERAANGPVSAATSNGAANHGAANHGAANNGAANHGAANNGAANNGAPNHDATDHANTERVVAGSAAPHEAAVAQAFHQAPVVQPLAPPVPSALPPGPPQDAPDVIAAELAGWASGELPGQASEQLAAWAADAAASGRKLPQLFRAFTALAQLCIRYAGQAENCEGQALLP